MPQFPLTEYLLFPSGLLMGLVLGWMIFRLLLAGRIATITLEFRSEIATLSENLRNRVVEIERLNGEAARSHEKMDEAQILISDLEKKAAGLETLLQSEREGVSHLKTFLQESRNHLSDSFKALSMNVLNENSASFMTLASTSFAQYVEAAKHDMSLKNMEMKEIVKPVKEAMDRYDKHIQVLELEREKAYGSLTQQMAALSEDQKNLQKETGKLVKALQTPHTRGRWGELTLKRVAELAGMIEKCDFFEQESAQTESGVLRPDMIVRLPGDRNIIVDAKVPLSAYLDAVDAETDDQRKNLLETHARHVETHIQRLSQKSYFTQFKPTPEFVVLFIPGENFFSAALVKNPNLIEEGVQKGIVIATPTTLIALLKAVSYGWRQEAASQNAQAIGELGHELYERLFMLCTHVNKVGSDIEKAMNSYNQMVGSFEKRVFVSARKFEQMGVKLKKEGRLDLSDPLIHKARTLEIAEERETHPSEKKE